MNKVKLLLAGSASLLSIVAVSTPAFAQIATLTPGEPSVQEVETSPTVTVEFNPDTEVTTSTSTKEEAVTVNFRTLELNKEDGRAFGQSVFSNSNFAANVGYNQKTDTVVTVTPDGTGGFNESEPKNGATVQTSDSAVSNLQGSISRATAITGMLREDTILFNADGATADTITRSGNVNTDSTIYEERTGKASFDPVTGQINETSVESESVQSTVLGSSGLNAVQRNGFAQQQTNVTGAGIRVQASGEGVVAQSTTLSADGLNTTGNVGANLVAANLVAANDVILDGDSLVATIADLKDADVTLQSSIDFEAATRLAADTALGGLITAEETARIAGDTALGGRITAEETARIAGDAAILASANTNTTNAVAAEAALRATADTALGGRITAEETARIAAVTAEATARATADTTLQSNINAEAATRLAADTALGGRITAEETARIAAVTAEATTRAAADTAEIASRIAADTALGGRITSEETARAAADTAIGVRIATEETARAAADTAIGTRITTESNARVAADLAESNARIASDNALGSRITDETNARIAADDVLRDQIASSTATAIALGGNAILPDANFTLAGNMGFYNGATAVSINAAGKVGSNTYLTAAVGGGLNKQGKVGGRVGVVFGF